MENSYPHRKPLQCMGMGRMWKTIFKPELYFSAGLRDPLLHFSGTFVVCSVLLFCWFSSLFVRE